MYIEQNTKQNTVKINLVWFERGKKHKTGKVDALCSYDMYYFVLGEAAEKLPKIGTRVQLYIDGKGYNAVIRGGLVGKHIAKLDRFR